MDIAGTAPGSRRAPGAGRGRGGRWAGGSGMDGVVVVVVVVCGLPRLNPVSLLRVLTN